MTDQLAVRNQMALTFDEMTRAAKAMAQSGYFDDARDVAKAMVKVLAGQEIGLGPFAAMSGIHVIKGKPVMGANLIATLIKNDSRYNYRVDTLNDNECVISFYENGDRVGESTFTMADAKQAGIMRDNWKKYPRNMLFARAISNGARWYTPGIFGGATIYTPDEMDVDVDEEGNVVTLDGPAPQPANGQRQPEQEPDQGDYEELDEKPSGTFWATVYQRIPYFNAAKHAEHAAGLLGIEYPQDKDGAAAALMILEQYAQLRADGVEQDEAVARVKGEAEPEEA